MAIDRINIQTTAFTLRATNIRGPQLRSLVDSLRRSSAAAQAGAPGAAPRTGPAAIQSPAERFPQVAAGDEGKAPAGFAAGGSDQMRALDTNGFMRLIMQLLERLLAALFGSLAGGADDAAVDGGGRATGGGCGATGLDSGAPPASQPPGGGGAEPVPPRATPAPGRPRARPCRKPSLAKRLLAGIGRNAARVAPLAVPGGPVGAAAAAQLIGPASGGSCAPSRAGGGSLEDRIFEFLSSKLREVEGELEGAMQQQDAGGAAGGDSRSSAAQKVQQLIQKRSQMVELLSNSLKTLHDSSMAVNRNIRT